MPARRAADGAGYDILDVVIGMTVGSYRILSRVGKGGMGAVYLAEHPLIGRRAAIKVLLPQYSSNAEIVGRFINEARSTSMLKHPGIVDIYDFGHHDSGSAYIVMEYLEGVTLSAYRRDRGRLPSAQIVDLARQIAVALGVAHGKGVIHRDLKPDNVFLVEDNDLPHGVRTKLLDFGIAKLAGDSGSFTKTRTGTLIGTPQYMSPEQCRGTGGLDHRSDLYSLGCIMFEMASGRPPFTGEGFGDVIAAHLLERPASLPAETPPALDALVQRLLAKRPAERPSSAAEVIEALDTIAPGASARPPSRRITLGEAGEAPRSDTTLSKAASEVMTGRPPVARLRAAVAVMALVVLAGGALWRVVLVRSPASRREETGAAGAVTSGNGASVNSVNGALGNGAVANGVSADLVNGTSVNPGNGAASSAGGASVNSANLRNAVNPAHMAAHSGNGAASAGNGVPAGGAAKATAPGLVTSSIRSTPAGADVFDAAGQRLGSTPFTRTVAASPDKTAYMVHKPGYRDERVVLAGDHDDAWDLTLAARPQPVKRAKKRILDYYDPFVQKSDNARRAHPADR